MGQLSIIRHSITIGNFEKRAISDEQGNHKQSINRHPITM
jgi:hypothetical protein